MAVIPQSIWSVADFRAPFRGNNAAHASAPPPRPLSTWQWWQVFKWVDKWKMLFGHFPQYFCDKSSVNIKRRQALCKTIIHTNILLIPVLKLDLWMWRQIWMTNVSFFLQRNCKSKLVSLFKESFLAKRYLPGLVWIKRWLFWIHPFGEGAR